MGGKIVLQVMKCLPELKCCRALKSSFSVICIVLAHSFKDLTDILCGLNSEIYIFLRILIRHGMVKYLNHEVMPDLIRGYFGKSVEHTFNMMDNPAKLVRLATP